MSNTVVLRQSARSEVLWALHCALEQAESEGGGREGFARIVLRELGVKGRSVKMLAKDLAPRLPSSLEETDMVEILAVFEEALPIVWHEDRNVLSRESGEAFRVGVLRILAERQPSQLPKAVVKLIVGELKRTVGSGMDESALPRLEETLEELLIRQLWQSKDKESQERLADWIMHDVERAGRVAFAEDGAGDDASG